MSEKPKALGAADVGRCRSDERHPMTSADRSTPPATTCELTCPSCGARYAQTMPTDACIYYFECTACDTMMKPKPGDCCVFCSYGSVPCPPIQVARASGGAGTTCCG